MVFHAEPRKRGDEDALRGSAPPREPFILSCRLGSHFDAEIGLVIEGGRIFATTRCLEENEESGGVSREES